MQFIRSISPKEATGQLAELYARDREAGGGGAPIIAAWGLRPDVLEAWTALNGAIRSHLDQRRYELVTLVAAARVKCSV
jgi:hypothetical protein